MPVSFNLIPNSNRAPQTMVEIDGSQALSARGSEPHRVLAIGIRLSTGTAVQGQIVRIVGENDGDAYFGASSHLAAMTRAFKRVNKTADLYAMALDEASGGTAATCTFPLTGTATADGTLRARIGDQRVSIAVTSGTAAAAAGTALASAITNAERLMWTAASVSGTVTLTNRHKGEVGNGYTIEIESIPAGLSCTPTQPTNGATNPTMATAITAFDDSRYDTFVTGLTDATSMTALENEALRRWGPTVKTPTMVIAGVRGSHGTLTTYGNARNSAYSCVIGSGLSPTPPWIFAAQAAARDAQRCDTQPNRPRNKLTLPDCEAPTKANQFDGTERNLLLYDGISTFKCDQAGNVMIERLITTYQVNGQSLSDPTYLAIETMRNLASIYLDALSRGAKYDDYLLVPDGTNVSTGVPALSPKSFKGELQAWYEGLIRRGRCKDLKGFISTLVVEINEDDPERLDVEMSPRLVGGVVTIAIKIAFKL